MTEPSGEVELVCLGDTAHILDLGLKMVRGSRVRTTLSAISRSRDLETAKAQGIVGVKVMKAQTIKQDNLPTPTEHSANQRAITRSAVHPSTAAHPGAQVVPTEFDQSPVLRALRELTAEVRSLREEVRRLPTTPIIDPNLIPLITEAVRVAFSGFSFTPGAGPSVQSLSSTEERFIPRGIVTGTAKLDIETARSTTGGVDDAEAALRAARRSRPKDEEGQDG